MGTTSVVDEFLHAIENAAIASCDVWSADATLDATVPNWRLHAGRRRTRSAPSTRAGSRTAASSASCAGTRWPAAPAKSSSTR